MNNFLLLEKRWGGKMKTFNITAQIYKKYDQYKQTIFANEVIVAENEQNAILLYKMTLDDEYSSRFISLTIDCVRRMRNLTVEENTILAEKALSLLERRLTTYKNLVELAVHLD